MKLEGAYTFEAPLDTVWQGLFDPEVLARTLPGCDKLERQGDQFAGEINVKMGPVQGKFQGKVDIQDVKDRESYTMVVDGRGPSGFVKATAHIRVSTDGAGTRLDYNSDVQVGGRIASVGQRLIDASSRAIVKQSLEGLHAQLKVLAARSELLEPAAIPMPFVPPDAEIETAELRTAELQTAELQTALSPTDAPPTDAQTPVSPQTGGADEPATAELEADVVTRERSAARKAITEPPKAPRSAPPRPQPLPAPSPPGFTAVAAHRGAPAAPRAPSQAAFALGVAKEVTKELLPGRTLAVLLLLAVAAFIAFWVKSR